jgi:hypothetical protein
MTLLPEALRAALRANAEAHRVARARNADEPDPVPLVKLFNPCGTATWLATELGEDGDTLFGLADLGFGCPELGYFSLGEIERLRLPFGLRIERDPHFQTDEPLTRWAAVARRAGSVLFAEQMLRQVPAEGGSASGAATGSDPALGPVRDADPAGETGSVGDGVAGASHPAQLGRPSDSDPELPPR